MLVQISLQGKKVLLSFTTLISDELEKKKKGWRESSSHSWGHDPKFFTLFLEEKKKKAEIYTSTLFLRHILEYLNLILTASLWLRIIITWEVERFRNIILLYTLSPTQACFLKPSYVGLKPRIHNKCLGTAVLGTKLRNQDTIFIFYFKKTESKKREGNHRGRSRSSKLRLEKILHRIRTLIRTNFTAIRPRQNNYYASLAKTQWYLAKVTSCPKLKKTRILTCWN